MAELEKRIEALEKILINEEWETVTLKRYCQDCSKAGYGKPPELVNVLKSGRPGKPGREYRRQESETEHDFLERIEQEEKRIAPAA
jgi:hypothetical protein